MVKQEIGPKPEQEKNPPVDVATMWHTVPNEAIRSEGEIDTQLRIVDGKWICVEGRGTKKGWELSEKPMSDEEAGRLIREMYNKGGVQFG